MADRLLAVVQDGSAFNATISAETGLTSTGNDTWDLTGLSPGDDLTISLGNIIGQNARLVMTVDSGLLTSSFSTITESSSLTRVISSTATGDYTITIRYQIFDSGTDPFTGAPIGWATRDTLTVEATIQAGPTITSFTYPQATAAAQTESPSVSATAGSTFSYAIIGTTQGASVNASTGVLSWPTNEGTNPLGIIVRVTATLNGLTDTADFTATQLGGSDITTFSYGAASAGGGQVLASQSSTASTIAFAIVSGTGATINTSNGTLTWAANEAATSRTVTVRLTASRNGDVDTQDATATQLGGTVISAFSYPNRDSTAGIVADALTVTAGSTVSFAIQSGSGATVDSSSGTLTWTENTGTTNRSVTVRVTASRNGDTDTRDAVATQLGGVEISAFSYPTRNATAGNVSPAITATTGAAITYARQSGSTVATINASTGVITWPANEGASSRSVVVRATATLNGDTVTRDATATQSAGTEIDNFSYPTRNATAGTVSPTITITPGSTVSYARQSGSSAATVNSTTGVVTWTANEAAGDRTATIRVTATLAGDTDTFDAVATQQGGTVISAFSYANRNATAGTVVDAITITGGSATSFARQSGSTAATVASNGTVTWTNNDTTSNRSAVIRVTGTRNGDSDTRDATATQLAGPGSAGTYTYPQAVSAAVTATPSGGPTFTGTAGTWSISGTGATINSSTGVVTWTANTTNAVRSRTVRRVVTNNSYARTFDVATVTQAAAPAGGNFTILADDDDILAGNTATLRITASGLSAGSDFEYRLTVTEDGTQVFTNTYTGVTGLNGNTNGQFFTRGPFNVPQTRTYAATLRCFELFDDGEAGGLPVPTLIETRTSTETVTWTAIPPTDFTTNPVWANANANTGATASRTTAAVANGLPLPSISYGTPDANQPFTINATNGNLVWQRNPGNTNRTGTVRVTATNAVFQPGGGTYSEDYTVTQLAGPGVNFSYPVNKDATSGNQPVTANHVGTPTYSITAGTGATVNSSSGVLTWTANPDITDRTVTVQASVVNNGDTRTGTAIATQCGGVRIDAFSYPDVNAAGGTATPTVDVEPDSVLGFRISSGMGATMLNPTTGVFLWDLQEDDQDRTVTIEVTVTRNGASETRSAIATQLGGTVITSLTYPNQGAPAGSVSPNLVVTDGSTITYSLLSGSGMGASLDETTGVLTWTANTGNTNRTAQVEVSASRNGDIDTDIGVATQTSQNITANITGPNTANSNEISTFNGVLTGLAEGVTPTNYAWSLVSGTIISGQGTSQIEVDWSGTTMDIIGTINLTVTDSLGRTHAASTHVVAITFVGIAPPPTGGSGGYGIEFLDSSGNVVLRGDEVMTRRAQSGTVPSNRTVSVTGLDSTSRLVITLDITSPVANGFYTVTSPTPTTRTVTFGSGIPVGTRYTITVSR